MRKLHRYSPTLFKARDSVYSKTAADYAVSFVQALSHTKGSWAGKPFELIDWQEQIPKAGECSGVKMCWLYKRNSSRWALTPEKRMACMGR